MRCVAKYAYEHAYVHKRTFRIETLGGLVQATVDVKRDEVVTVTVNMGRPQLLREQIPMTGHPGETVIAEPMTLNGKTVELTAVSLGNPHASSLLMTLKKHLSQNLAPFLKNIIVFRIG